MVANNQGFKTRKNCFHNHCSLHSTWLWEIWLIDWFDHDHPPYQVRSLALSPILIRQGLSMDRRTDRHVQSNIPRLLRGGHNNNLPCSLASWAISDTSGGNLAIFSLMAASQEAEFSNADKRFINDSLWKIKILNTLNIIGLDTEFLKQTYLQQFLELSIVIFRDMIITIRTWSWSANSIMPGRTAWKCRLTCIYTGGKG